MSQELWIGIGLSLLLGALVGIQREMRQQQDRRNDFAGFRAYTFISILGFLIGYLATNVYESQDLVLIGLGLMFFFTIVAYRAVSKLHPKQLSITSEVVAVLVFIIGILISLGFYHISITLSILITGILYLSDELHIFAKKLKRSEFLATLKFAVISVVILPILPNENYTLIDFPFLGPSLLNQDFIPVDILLALDVFNFFHIWLFVVLISAIGYVGYILMKTIGAEKGVEVTGFLGGFMSSTALTTSFALESKRLNYLSNPLIIGAIIASSTMFIRILFEVWIVNPNLLVDLIVPMLSMGIFGYIISFYLFSKTKLKHIKEVNISSPFTLGPALKFAGFFVLILVVTKLFTLFFGERGIYFVAFLSGIADVDAITISLSNLALDGDITNSAAVIGIMLAAFANTFFKAGIAYYLGSRNFSKGVLKTFTAICVFGLIVLIIV